MYFTPVNPCKSIVTLWGHYNTVAENMHFQTRMVGIWVSDPAQHQTPFGNLFHFPILYRATPVPVFVKTAPCASRDWFAVHSVEECNFGIMKVPQFE